MGFLGDIEEIEQYLTIWEKVRNLDKLNIKVLIDHKIKLLGEYTQDRNTTLAESIVEVVKLKDLLSATRFAPDSVETLISKMVQDSMLRNGLEVVEEPELVRSCTWPSRSLAELTRDRFSTAKSLVCMRS